MTMTPDPLEAPRAAPAGDATKPALEKRVHGDTQGHKLPYRLLLPAQYDRTKKYPLVVFLHGAGERGADNEKQLVHAVPEFLREDNRKKHPCFLIAPQCPDGLRWSEVDWSAEKSRLPARPSEPARLLLELLDAFPKEWNVDPDRIYLTGLSMGGFGTWDLICRRPDFFAAAVPVCGGGDETQADKIAQLPVWAFHGAKDEVVKPQRSRNMIEAIRKAGGKPRYTEYPNEGHASWVPAYRDPDMMAWLFAQKRQARR